LASNYILSTPYQPSRRVSDHIIEVAAGGKIDRRQSGDREQACLAAKLKLFSQA